MNVAHEDLSFSFQYIWQSGQAKGLFAKKGSTTAKGVMLNDELLPYEAIVDTTVRDDRLIMAIDANKVSQHFIDELEGRPGFAIKVNKIKALDLEKHVDRMSSRVFALRHRKELEEEGKGSEFRANVCPHCKATIDLSGIDKSKYIYCRFCESVFDNTKAVVTVGDDYRCCDECGMFDRVRGYTEFYFYFLILVYGYNYQRRHLCDACAARMSMKMLMLNSIFLLGVPVAIYNRIRSMRGRQPQLKQLAKANALALKGLYQDADAIYHELNQNYRHHPGLLRNQAIAHLYGNDPNGAKSVFEQSMKACTNYEPTIRLIMQLNSPQPQPLYD